MIVLGIVGSPAAGKSTVAEFLAELGADWINADLIARSCLEEPDIVAKLTSRFGDQIIGPHGAIDRGKVADFVFRDDSAGRENLEFLESLIHPRTRAKITERISGAAKRGLIVALLDVPLLFESGWDRSCDAIWCIDASRETRLSRSKIRGWDANELDRRSRNQIPMEAKRRLSNLVMRNDSTLDSLRENLRCQWSQLVRMKSDSPGNASSFAKRHCLSDRMANP